MNVTDPARVAAVRATGLLDTPAEAAFDRLTRLATKLTGAPVTLISLLDGQRDFYKSCFGFSEPLASERQMTGTTFCHYTLSSDGPLIIDDALGHPLYGTVPTVQSLGVRAYLGIPLHTSAGYTIGSFCAIDFRPRKWTALDVEVMSELAVSTLREIELRMALDASTEDQRRLRSLSGTNERLYMEARLANDEKDRFFAAVTHELRTPMTSIIGWARILAMTTLNSPDAAEAVQMIENSARAQARLVDDLLDASRIATGKITVNPDVIDLNRVLAEAVRALHPVAESNGVRLISSVETLPSLFADASRIRQILDNLISNAIKFTAPGGSVEVLATRSEAVIRVEIRDTGRGIPEDVLPHIFERGWQANSAEHGGMGLGLTIASYLAERHGGSLAAESNGVDQGSTFRLTLPIENTGP